MKTIAFIALCVLLIAPFAASQSTSDGVTCYSQSFSGLCVVGGGVQTRDGTSGQQVADAAAKYVGILRYIWGGTSLESGADCSGFVQQLFAQYVGTSIPRLASAQFQKGTAVSRGQLAPGNLVFFSNTYKPGISHVGVFTGSGPYGSCTFIEAPGTGKVVKYSNLCTGFHGVDCTPGYSRPCYAGGRRVTETQLAAG